ncbi:MAG: hypothetical protein ABR600_00885 [Actinomycetota bacterium]
MFRRRGSADSPLARAEVAVAAGILAAGGAFIGYAGRFWSFFYDEWGLILYRRAGGASSFLAAHNGHLQAVVVGTYRLLFATVGLRSYHPYAAVVIGAHLVVVALVYRYARPRIGSLPAALVSLPLLLLGSAWQVLFWAINLGFVIPIIVLCLLLLIERWRPWVVATLLLVALASSGLGVAVVAAAGVLACSGKDRRLRLLSVAIPAGLYAAWFVFYRPNGLPPAPLRSIPGASPTGDVGFIHFPLGNIARAPGYILHSAKAAADALSATGTSGGWWTLLALTVAIACGIGLRRRITFRLAALVAALGVFWLETALTRAHVASPESPGASRYLYPGAVLLVLILIEVFDGVRIPPPAVLVLAVGVGAVLVSDVDILRSYGRAARVAFAREAALLRRAACDPASAPGYRPDPLRAPGVTVGPYRAAVRALGFPPGQACPDGERTHVV